MPTKSQTDESVPAPVHDRCSSVAQRIAADILTVAGRKGPVECTRAQMMLKQPDGSERDMGGRCKASIANTIDEHLTLDPVIDPSKVKELLKLTKELSDRVTELEGHTPSKDDREKYVDQLCAILWLQVDHYNVWVMRDAKSETD